MFNQYIRPFPKVIRIEPAGSCNLKCSHCPTGTVKMSRSVMKPTTFSLILNSLQAHLDEIKVVVLYHGGEPLLNRNFAEMIKEIKSLNIP